MARNTTQAPGRKVDPSRFAMVPRNDVPRSAFSVQHTHKTAFNAGKLIPIYVDEVLPGDSHSVKMTAFARLATTVVPVMDNLYFESFFFFVPNRLVWNNWRRFMGEQASPTDSTVFLVPQVTGINDAASGFESLMNYFGVHNQLSGNSISVNALPLRAYHVIWDEWFRDQDLEDPLNVTKGDGPDAIGTYVNQPLHRGKRPDYFTTARPWPQKPLNIEDSGVLGGPLIPGGRMTFPQAGAPVSGIGVAPSQTGSVGGPRKETGGRNNIDYPFFYSGVTPTVRATNATANSFPDVRVLINDIRTSNAVQLLLEKNARGGTRYTEIIRSHFGVVSPDARLQRPEYLGGGRSMVTVNPIAQTSATGQTGSTTPLGDLAGIGTAVATGHGFSASFTEHGYIIGLVSVRADLTYQQGINRMWFRRTQFDFYWPSLAHLGEQAVLSKEIYADGSANDENVFGYQERWAEYKSMPSRVSGRLRSRDPLTLDVWHLAQFFTTRPVLNNAYIRDLPPVSRVALVDQWDEVAFICDAQFNARKVRCMPMYSIPGLGGGRL